MYLLGTESPDGHIPAECNTLLNGIQSRFILSLNDVPEVRDIFKDFNIESVKTKYSLAGKNRKKETVGEVLISN